MTRRMVAHFFYYGGLQMRQFDTFTGAVEK